MSWYLKPHDKSMRSVPKPAPQRQFLEQSASFGATWEGLRFDQQQQLTILYQWFPIEGCLLCMCIYMNSKWEYLFKYCFHTMNNAITTIDVCKEVEACPVKGFCHVLSVGNNSSCIRGLISNRIHQKWQPSLTAGNHFSSLPHPCFEKTIGHLVVDT